MAKTNPMRDADDNRAQLTARFPTKNEMLNQYYTLCDQRDALYAKVQPLEDQLTKVNSQIETLRAEQMKLASDIDDGLGRESFIELKKTIQQLATFLRFIPPRKVVKA